MSIPLRTRRVVATMVGMSVVLLGCATPKGLQPFTTDGCSQFPDRAVGGGAEWCRCCLVHDLAYWRGGTADERLAADLDLRRCVLDTSHSLVLAELMFAGVRSGGGPYYRTPYRWGYGWAFGRLYQPLSPTETALVDSLRAAYQARNPSLSCADSLQ